MILHAASMAALFVDQVTQAPVVVQCQPNTGNDPLWARLTVASLPSIFALGIAWAAFRWNRKNDLRRWALENKKAEWQKLLALDSGIEHFMPSVAIGGDLIKAVHDPSFNEHLHNMTRAALKCVFIPEERAEAIYQRVVNIQLINEESKGHIEDHSSNSMLAQQLGKPRPLEAAKNVQRELASLWREIRRYASADLDLEHQREWRTPFSRRRTNRSEAGENTSSESNTIAEP
jgi:hypothetical protein